MENKIYFDKIKQAEAELWNLSDGERTDLILDNFDVTTEKAREIVKAARIEIPTIPEPKDKVSNSEKVVEILLGVYETEKNRLPQGRSNYAPSFIKEVEEILVDMVPDLMRSNYGVTK